MFYRSEASTPTAMLKDTKIDNFLATVMIEKCIEKFSRNHFGQKSSLRDTGNYNKIFRTIRFEEILQEIRDGKLAYALRTM